MSDTRATLLRVLQAVGLIATLIIILFPLYWMVTGSLKSETDLFAIPPKWFFSPTIAAYTDAIQNTDVLENLLNSLIVTGCAVALGLLVGAPAAYGIARYRFRGRRDVWFWYVTNWMLVPVVVLIPFYLTASYLGLINNPIVLILVYQVFIVPLVVWLLVDQFSSVPVALEEAAQLDGLSRVSIFLRIRPAAGEARHRRIGDSLRHLRLERHALRLHPDTIGGCAHRAHHRALLSRRLCDPLAAGYGGLPPWSAHPSSSAVIIVHKYIARGLTMGAVK